jgi:hypothetical protein
VSTTVHGSMHAKQMCSRVPEGVDDDLAMLSMVCWFADVMMLCVYVCVCVCVCVYVCVCLCLCAGFGTSMGRCISMTMLMAVPRGNPYNSPVSLFYSF